MLTKSSKSDILNSVEELGRIAELMNDDHLDRALVIVIDTLRASEPREDEDGNETDGLSAAKAPRLIAELSTLATKFAFMATYYKTWGKDGTEERYKKDMYYTARDALNNLADAIKYIVRAQYGR